MKTPQLLAAGILTLLIAATVHADTFGSGGNSFTIDFVNISNPGNGNDAGAGGGIYSSPYGGVPYVYRMGVTEASQDWITKATASTPGLLNVTAGAWAGNQPAATMTWYEAAAFVNWLNTSEGHQAAYQIDETKYAADAVDERAGVAGRRGEPVSAQGRGLFSAERE